MFDMLLLLILPLILGFVGEKYIDAKTWQYAIFIIICLTLVETYYSFSAKSGFFQDMFCNALYFVAFMVSVCIFHLQKIIRKKH
jgi:hypothetical protein